MVELTGTASQSMLPQENANIQRMCLCTPDWEKSLRTPCQHRSLRQAKENRAESETAEAGVQNPTAILCGG
ncbi:hypothetical protein DPEC_G00316920 [Dallia pectoralis]|uniref:Uncharacterized protein n=1 Tax=Dallia pectoralis TaxID=75939 RepID=A0ACC2FCW2_DALPE|nr:hypothetical protein DPEC_G00316920 [Dallia pectoralis]